MIAPGTALLLRNPDQLAGLPAATRDPPAFPEPETLDLAHPGGHDKGRLLIAEKTASDLL
ncbi:hypothetical protein [Streptomyces sp. NPDC090798]|uniref:hypothetical protein n=1 Tax=Streptomyces sp. NPDC090798 TaxID=3365968 RepID=UPI003819C2B3